MDPKAWPPDRWAPCASPVCVPIHAGANALPRELRRGQSPAILEASGYAPGDSVPARGTTP